MLYKGFECGHNMMVVCWLCYCCSNSLSDVNNYATDAFMTGELQILHLSVCSGRII